MTSPIVASFDAFCTDEDIDPEVFKRVMTATGRTPDSPFALVEKGTITEDEFDVAVAKLLGDACGHPVVAKGLKQRMFAKVVPAQAMWDAVRAARAAGIRTALLSNSWGGRDYPLEQLREIFDEIVISGQVGMRKPDADIYRYTAAEVGVREDGCVFVDDFSVNVEGAEAVGMAGILHRDPTTTIERLEGIFSISLRASV